MATLRKATSKRTVSRKPAPIAAVASTVMTADPETVSEESSLFEAAASMAEIGVRHLPVVNENGVLVGMLSDRDIRSSIGDPVDALRGRRDESESRVSDVMTPDPLRATLDMPVAELASMLADERIGAVPVVDEGDHPVGIVSYVDLIRFLARAV